MNKTGRAYFVAFPRIIEDLKVLHDIKEERNYEIVARVKLDATDYENFITDMVADRQFIEDAEHVKELVHTLLLGRNGIEQAIDPHDRRHRESQPHPSPLEHLSD